MKAFTIFSSLLLGSLSLPLQALTLPATNLAAAELVTPATAWSLYGSSTTHTQGPGATLIRPPEVTALARGLGAERVGQAAPVGITADEYAERVADYVRNNIDIEFRFGLSKGARGALIDQSAGAFDQAHLMVELLREAGVTAGYRVGTVSLTAEAFGLWTGLVKNLNPVTQTFDMDAEAACRLLADGGIPAIVSGESDCDQVSGDLPVTGTPIVMGHIWVAANGKLYDPAYKQHRFRAGVDLAAAIGCGTAAAPTCGTTATAAAMTGASTGTVGGAPSITNLNEDVLRGDLFSKAQNLQGHIQTNMINAELSELIGGLEIDHSYTPVADTTLPYPSTTQYIWSGNIPDQFRTTLRLRYAVFDSTFYADEIAGKRIRVLGLPQGVTPGWLLYIEDLRIITAPCTTCSDIVVTLDVNHPYMADGGDYADEQVDLLLLASATPNVPPVTIVHGFGRAAPSTEQFYAQLQTVDPDPVFAADGFPKAPGPGFDPFCGGSFVHDGQLYEAIELCRNDSQPTIIAKTLAQGGVADRIVESIGNARLLRHHAIGMVASQAHVPSLSDLLSIQSSLSINHVEGDATERQATFETASAAWAMLEGSVAQQISDTWMPDSPNGLIVMANRKNIPLVNIAAASMSSVIPSLTNYDVSRQARLQYLADAGYDAIVPRSGTPGTFNISGVNFDWLVGGSLFYSDGSLAYMVNEAYKGGAAANGPDAPDEAVLNSARIADYAVNARKYLTVSPGSGELALDPPPDIVTGAGSFPDSLSLQRRYRSDSGTYETMSLIYGFHGTGLYFRRYWGYSGPDVNALAHLGGGWTHNYNISATLDNNAFKAMSVESALDSSAFIAGLYTLHDALRNPTFQRRLAAIFTAQWLNDRFIINAATIDVAGKVEVFARLPSGGFNPPPGSASSLIQIGDPIGPRILNPAYTVGYDYLPVTFVYTDRDGATLGFNGASETHNDVGFYGRSMFKPISWSFPGDGWIRFDYEWLETERSAMGSGLQRVYVAQRETISNHLGRSLGFTNNFRTVSGNPLRWAWVASRVTDENGRSIDYLPTGCPALMNWPGEGSATRAVACNLFTAETQDNVVTGYTYGAGVDSPNPLWIVRPDYRLRRTFVPSDLTEPFQTLAYDDLFRVREVTDALERSTRYYTGSASLRDRHVVAEVIEADNATWTHLFDRRGNLLRGTDPLDRSTTHEYDDIGRLLRTTYPEGNAEERAYDVRSNVLTVTQKSKPASALADIVTITTYGEGPNVKYCLNVRTCNKPATFTDARGQLTDYSWDPLHGDLLQLRLPPDEDGLRPQTNFGYSLYGSSPNEFRRLTSRTERINSTDNLVTTYSYNSGNKYVLQSAVVDSGGLNLTTGFTFDAYGNVTAVDGPRTDVVDVTHYTWDIHRRLHMEIGADPDATGPLLRPTTRYSYDLDSQLIETERGTSMNAAGAGFVALARTTHAYDAVGNKLRDTVMDGATTTPLAITQYSYDDVDRLDCTAVRMNTATFGSLPGSACTHTTAGSFGPDRITRSEYDLAGQLLKTIRAYGAPLQQDYATYTYTLNGQRETIADANNNLSTYEYDGFDRLAKLRFPVLTSGAGTSSSTDYEEYGYDANGNLTSLRKRDGNVIGYLYDNLNREIVKDMPGGTAEDVFTAYDLLGRRLFARFGSDTGDGIDYSYDAPGRLLTEDTFGRTLSYQYDAASNRTRITWPDSLYVQYTYDALNRMLQVRENGATSGQGLLASYGYDSLGRRSALSRGNGVSTAWAYDGMSRLTVLQQDAAGTTHDLTVTLAYSPASQLISRGADNDAYAWTGATPGTTSYGAATGLNQYPSIDSDPYSYDANGNLTVGGGRTRAYDVENRLISVTGSPSLSLGYDPLGRLRETSTGVGSTEFLYSGDALVAEYNAMGSLTQRYVHGAGIDEPLVSYTGAGTTSRSWLLADERGSIIATTTAAGAATLYAYGPYGEPNNWTGPRFRYTGQIALPEAELYHYKARAYDPVLGRFLQTDPVGYEVGMNLYAYVSNDPLNSRDPAGEVPVPWILIGAGVSGALQLTAEWINAGGVKNIDAAGWKRIGVSAAAGAVGGGMASRIGQLSTTSGRVVAGASSGGAVSIGHSAATAFFQEGRGPTGREVLSSGLIGAGTGLVGGVSAEVIRASGPSVLRAAQGSSLAERNLTGNINRATLDLYTSAEINSAIRARVAGQVGGVLIDSISSLHWESRNNYQEIQEEPVCAGSVFFSFGCP